MKSAAKLQESPERCVILCRVSSKGQRDKDTIEAQRRDLPVVAQRNDWPIVKLLADNGVTGLTSDRPDLQEALAMAERREYEVLLVRSFDRIMRSDDLEAYEVYSRIKKLGIKIATPQHVFDLRQSGDNFMHKIHRAIAELDRENLLGNMRAGRKTHVSRAGRIGRDPYSYTWQADKSQKSGGQYALVPAEQKIVERIFARALTTGVSEIAYELNMKRVPTRPVLRNTKDREGNIVKPRVPTLWDHASVLRILHNPIYKGERTIRLEGEAPIVQHVPKVVSPEEWERVQVAISKRQCTRKHKHNAEYLCRNILKCAECGYRMWYLHAKSGGHRQSYYRCATTNWKKMKRMAKCQQVGHRSGRIDTAVWAKIVETLSDSALLTEALRTVRGRPTEDWAAAIAEIERELETIDAHEDRIIQWSLQGFNQQKLEAARTEVQQRRTEASERLCLAKRDYAEAASALKFEMAISDVADKFRAAAKNARFAKRRELMMLLMTRKTDYIVLHRDGRADIHGSIMVLGTARPFEVRVPCGESTNSNVS